MIMKKLCLFILLLIFTSNITMACQFDTDCEPGSKCLKSDNIYEICARRMYPGNSHDGNPVKSATDQNVHIAVPYLTNKIIKIVSLKSTQKYASRNSSNNKIIPMQK